MSQDEALIKHGLSGTPTYPQVLASEIINYLQGKGLTFLLSHVISISQQWLYILTFQLISITQKLIMPVDSRKLSIIFFFLFHLQMSFNSISDAQGEVFITKDTNSNGYFGC
jgi:hypothetical protein